MIVGLHHRHKSGKWDILLHLENSTHALEQPTTTSMIVTSLPKTDKRLLEEALYATGFDIFHGPFSPKIYNDCIQSEGLVDSGLLSKLPEEFSTTNINNDDSNDTTV